MESENIFRKAKKLESHYQRLLKKGNTSTLINLKRDLDRMWDKFYKQSREEYFNQ